MTSDARESSLDTHPLEARLRAAQLEGLEPNLRRQLGFIGDFGSVIELQALKVQRRADDAYERTKAAHASSVASAVALATEAERWTAQGIYLLPAQLKEGVETRHAAPGKWFDIPKSGGTTDADIEARLVLAIDFDVKRPSSTSATQEEIAKSIAVALDAWKYLAGALGEDCLAYLHSGNGRQIHIALDHLSPGDSKSYLGGILAGLARLYNTSDVSVDEKLFDAKRILPACGTSKKKGAPGILLRPHRQTAIVGPETVRRATFEQIQNLSRTLWENVDDDGRAAMLKAMGIKSQPSSVTPITSNPDSPFALANAVDPREVAHWLGILDGDEVRCPGCGETSGVALLRFGLKCHHNRCQVQGINGFRSMVDLVREVHNVSPIEAVKEIGERFNFEAHFKSSVDVGSSSTEQLSYPDHHAPRFEWIATGDIFAPLPPTEWLVPELHLVRGRPTLLAGYGFSGKTLMAQALALAVSAASPVWDEFKTPKPQHVRHLDYEQGKHATLKRYQRLAIGHQIAPAALADRLQVAVFPEVYLDTPGAQDVYARAVEGVAVVILDALRGATPTLDENDSTIRRCIDNLTRVSEKTGTAFFILHHAGKGRDEEADPRKAPRGSSAIFDACGCVFIVTGEKNAPKRVQQTKAPAEAEGGEIPEFFLAIEDIAHGGSPTGGLRVRHLNAAQAKPQTGNGGRLDALKADIVELVKNVPTLTSSNSICTRVSGSKDFKLTAIHELMECGVLSQPGGKGTPFLINGGGFFQVVRTGLFHSKDRSGGLPPLKGETDGPKKNPPLFSPPTGPTRKEQKSAQRAERSEKDADELECMPKKEWKAHAIRSGWTEARASSARALAHARDRELKADVDAINAVRNRDEDPPAWATEQGWPDDRIQRAMNFKKSSAEIGITAPESEEKGE